MEQLPNLPSNFEAGIGAFRRQVNETFLGNLPYSCAPSKRKEMLEWIGAGIPQKDFFEALMEYLYVDKRFPVEDAVVALRGSLVTKPTTKEVKTVGMYYYRHYNGGIERVMSLLSVVLKRAGYRVVIVTEEGPIDLDYGCLFQKHLQRLLDHRAFGCGNDSGCGSLQGHRFADHRKPGAGHDYALAAFRGCETL